MAYQPIGSSSLLLLYLPTSGPLADPVAGEREAQRRGFDPSLRRFFFFGGRRDVFLEVNIGSDSFPLKILLDESVNRGLVAAHLHFKRWHSWSRRVNAGNKNTPSMHHSRRRNVTTSIVGLKKRSLTQNSHPKW